MLLLHLQFFQVLFVWGTVTGAVNSSQLLFQSFFSDVQERAGTMQGQSSKPLKHRPLLHSVSVGSLFLTWKEGVQALASVLSMQGFPSATPCHQLGWDIFSWPSFHGLLHSWFLLSLSSCVWFFPIVFFTMSTSCPLPSQEAVHCYFRFFYLQTVVQHLRNLLFLPLLPSTVKSRHPRLTPSFTILTREISPLPV